MPADLTTVHINRALTSLSIALENNDTDYLLMKMCGRKKVKADSDSFFRYGRELARTSERGSNARVLTSVTAAGSPAPEVVHTASSGSYKCQRYSLREKVTDKEILRADAPLSPLLDAGRLVRRRVLNDAEYVLALLVADADNYNASNKVTLTTGGSGTSWNYASVGSANSNPLTDIRTARVVVEKIIQQEANVMAMSAETMYHLSDHTDLSGILQYTDSTYLSRSEAVPPQLRGLNVLRGKAVSDTAAAGASFSGDYLFNDQTDSRKEVAIICHVPEGGNVGERDFCSFIWFDGQDPTTRQHGVSLRSYRDEAIGCWWVEAAMNMDIQYGVVDSSGLITGAYGIFDAIS